MISPEQDETIKGDTEYPPSAARDNDVIWGGAMIVLGICASIIAVVALTAIVLLMNIHFERHADLARIF